MTLNIMLSRLEQKIKYFFVYLLLTCAEKDILHGIQMQKICLCKLGLSCRLQIHMQMHTLEYR